jgi:PAS domain S-box-containing protein
MDRSIQELTWEHDVIIDSSSDGLFVCDGSGRILRVNPASQRINNATAEQLVGRAYLDAAEEGLVILPSAALEAVKSRNVVSLLQENRFGRKLISTATPVFDDAGELIRVVVSERDITETDRLQRQLEEQQAIGDHFRHQVQELQEEFLASHPVIAKSPCMVKALKQALKVSEVDSTVLILGESGVGKGLVADLIHSNSRRSEKPVIKINCGAIPETLIEAELFGYEKGAFTGAVGSKPGHLELADGGTLFLDEIAELPLASQVKLLRFMEDGVVTRLGGTQSRKVDVRLLAATNRDLDQLVASGLFRTDLFYRLSVVPLHVPALRERRECLIALIRSYIDHFAERSNVSKRLSAAALDVLIHYHYPGNVRELMNICERLVVMSDTEVLDVGDLPQDVVAGAEAGVCLVDSNWPEGMNMTQILESVEKRVLSEASKRYRKQQDVAEALGMSQPTVARKLQKYGIDLRNGHAEV